MEIDNDDFSIDLEEEFDPLDEQELDVEIDETPIDKPIDDRNPVLMSAKGFSKGAKEYFIDDNNMERILFRSMPSEYRESRNFVRDRFKGIKSIYDDAAKELKEPIRQLKRSGREIRKMMGDSIPEVIGKRLDSLLEEGYSRDDGYKGLNQDAIRDNQIAATIADIFHAEQMQQQETISEDRVQRQVEFSVARDQKDLLRSIAQNSFRSLDIQSNITSRYQQKALDRNDVDDGKDETIVCFDYKRNRHMFADSFSEMAELTNVSYETIKTLCENKDLVVVHGFCFKYRGNQKPFPHFYGEELEIAKVSNGKDRVCKVSNTALNSVKYYPSFNAACTAIGCSQGNIAPRYRVEGEVVWRNYILSAV